MILAHEEKIINKSSFKKMKHSEFVYNKKNAKCNFCIRKANPHPDFDEPIVIRDIKINNKNLSICINCHYEFVDDSDGNEIKFKDNLIKKYNLINLLNKMKISPKI